MKSELKSLSPNVRRWLVLVQRMFLILAFGAIGFYLYLHRAQIGEVAGGELFRPAAVAITVFLLLHPVIVFSFYAVQKVLGVPRSYVTTLSSYLTRLPARYIPGGIWHSASRYLDVQLEHDVGAGVLGRIFLLEICIAAATGFIVGGYWNLNQGQASGNAAWLFPSMLAIGLAGIVVLLVLTWHRFAAHGLRWLLWSQATMLLVWPIAALSFAQLASPILKSAADCGLNDLAATHVAAASLGYIAIFAPQGWGVSEVAYAGLASCQLLLPRVLLSFIAFRLCSLVADLLAFLTWMLLTRGNVGGSVGADQ